MPVCGRRAGPNTIFRALSRIFLHKFEKKGQKFQIKLREPRPLPPKVALKFSRKLEPDPP